MKGFGRIHIGGQSRAVKFGVNQTIEFCRLRGISQGEYFKFIADKLKDAGGDGSELRDLIWSALKDGARVEGKTAFDTTPETVGDWMEDFSGQADILRLFVDSMPLPDDKKEAIKKKVAG